VNLFRTGKAASQQAAARFVCFFLSQRLIFILTIHEGCLLENLLVLAHSIFQGDAYI
jgi:hypothetical protein